MKQKRKIHEISDDENNALANASFNSNDKNKRLKLSQSTILPEIDPEEDEVWLVRLPSQLNPDELHDKQITLKSKTKNNERIALSINDTIKRYYNPHITKWKKNQTCLTVLNPDETGNFALTSVECKGEIKFVEEVQVPSIGDIEVPPKLFVNPPKDLQRRHPFFGMNVPTFPKTSRGDLISSVEIKTESDRNEILKLGHAPDKVQLVDGELIKVKIEPDAGEKKKKKKKKHNKS